MHLLLYFGSKWLNDNYSMVPIHIFYFYMNKKKKYWLSSTAG